MLPHLIKSSVCNFPNGAFIGYFDCGTGLARDLDPPRSGVVAAGRPMGEVENVFDVALDGM